MDPVQSFYFYPNMYFKRYNNYRISARREKVKTSGSCLTAKISIVFPVSATITEDITSRILGQQAISPQFMLFVQARITHAY